MALIENQTLLQFFDWYTPADSDHWKHLENEVMHIQSLGVTALWLPPAYKGTRGKKSEGYDVYDLYDLGEFYQKETVATKYGTKDQYLHAVNVARSAGLKVYVDIVLNHMGGAETSQSIQVRKVDPENRLRISDDVIKIEAYTKFEFAGRNKKHSAFNWDSSCFTAVDHAIGAEEKGIYMIENNFGPEWKNVVGSEKGNFDYLILNDIETRNPAVRKELKTWGRWYYETARFDGVRLDAVKHMDPDFCNDWLDYMRSEVNPDLLAIGEYWLSDDLPVLMKYIEATGNRMHLFDAPLHHNLVAASLLRERGDLRKIFDNTLIDKMPTLAVTFVDNHDTQPLQSLEEFTADWFKPHAYALILLREAGLPCVFYPDLYGSSSANPIDEVALPVPQPPVAELPMLLNARKQYAYGKQEDFFDEPDCIGWTRYGDPAIKGSGCAVILTISQREVGCKKMRVGSHFAGRYFCDMSNSAITVKIDPDGWGMFPVKSTTISVWHPI